MLFTKERDNGLKASVKSKITTYFTLRPTDSIGVEEKSTPQDRALGEAVSPQQTWFYLEQGHAERNKSDIKSGTT